MKHSPVAELLRRTPGAVVGARLVAPQLRAAPQWQEGRDSPFGELGIVETVGQGRRCAVYGVRWAGSDLVLKVYLPQAAARHARRVGGSIARYEYERNLACHSVPRLRDFAARPLGYFTSSRAQWFLQERVRGESLLSLARTAPADLAAVLADLAAIVRHAHGAGLYDLDLHPDNILVERSAQGAPRPVLFDLNKVPYHVCPPSPLFGALLKFGPSDPEARDLRYLRRLHRILGRVEFMSHSRSRA